MTDEPLTTLGKSLRAEYQSWLVCFVPSWPDKFRLAVYDWETMGQADAAFTRLLRQMLEWLELDDWLTSGFLPLSVGADSFAPIAAGGFPGVPSARTEITPATAAFSVPPSQAGFGLHHGEDHHDSIPVHRPAQALDLINSVHTAAISGSESAVLPTTAGPESGFSAGGLQDLARVLQASPAIETGVGSTGESLAAPPPSHAQTAWPESAGAAVSSRPVLSKSARANLSPSAAGSESAEADTAVRITQTVTVAESATGAVAEDAVGFMAADLRRLGQELGVDYPRLFESNPAGPYPQGAAELSAGTDWRHLLLTLPLRREVSSALQARTGNRKTPTANAPTGLKPVEPTGITIGDDDLYRAIPEVVQHNATTGISAKPKGPAATPPDLYDLLEALSQEIWREYQRFYGSG